MKSRVPIVNCSIDLFKEQQSMKNPSTEKLKRKSFLKKAERQQQYPILHSNPLRMKDTNIPARTINLLTNNRRSGSIESLQKCRSQLSQQKRILLKELQKKEEKMEKLRLTFRKIQTSQSKTLFLKDSEPVTHFKDRNSENKPEQRNKKQKSLLIHSPAIRYHRGESGSSIPLRQWQRTGS